LNGSDRPAVFLDRDGVINETLLQDQQPVPLKNVNDVQIVPGVPQALQKLKDAGFLLIVVTNQPDVARGTITIDAVEAIHRTLMDSLPLDAIFSCYHDDPDRCHCRKPKPGMLLQAAALHSIDLTSSFVVGDRWKDIAAGRSAGCKTIRIQQAYSEPEPPFAADHIARSLTEAVPWILAVRDKQESVG
jgi:D-glycero-D-manno-heptose 1,7-bisphosphate phosphatase